MGKYYTVRKVSDGSFIPQSVEPPATILAKLTPEHPISACKYAEDHTPVFVVMARGPYDAVDKVEKLTKMFVRCD